MRRRRHGSETKRMRSALGEEEVEKKKKERRVWNAHLILARNARPERTALRSNQPSQVGSRVCVLIFVRLYTFDMLWSSSTLYHGP